MTLYQMMVAGGWDEAFICGLSLAAFALGYFVRGRS